MSATTAAWIVLAAPLAGTIVTGALFRRLPGRSAGWIGTAAIAVSFVFALIALAKLAVAHPGPPRADLDAVDDRRHDRRRRAR